MVNNLLLVSNSKTRDQPKVFLGYCEKEITEHFAGVKTVLFIPYAGPSAIDELILSGKRKAGEKLEIPKYEERMGSYTKFMKQRFEQMGFELRGIQDGENARKAVNNAEAIYVGGGNTFDLLRKLQGTGVTGHIKERVKDGMPYLGVSAGTVIAGMNIATSNDNAKPVGDLDALQFIPFGIKPHYLDKIVVTDEERAKVMEINPRIVDLIDHQGESHKDRIMEYHHDFPYPVIGLREGGILKIKGDEIKLLGTGEARIFYREDFVNGYEPAKVYKPGDLLDHILYSDYARKDSPRGTFRSREIIHQAETGPDSWLASLSEFERYLYLIGG